MLDIQVMFSRGKASKGGDYADDLDVVEQWSLVIWVLVMI